MPPGINTSITWSLLELSGLLEDEDTRVCFQRARKHLGLHPFHLNDLTRAVREILDSNVNAYDPELQGFVLAYKNPKLVSQLGAILHDSCFIHVDVEADFYIFKPEVGCVLKGIANKKASTHIGVLVHKAFNVSIPKPDDCDDWFGDYVFVGQEVKFTVTHLDFKGKLPFVRGELISDNTSHPTYDNECSSVTGEQPERKQRFVIDEVNSSRDEPNLSTKKKRSKKSRTIDSSGDEISDCDDKRKITKKQNLKSPNKNNKASPEEKTNSKISKKRKAFDSNSEDSSENEDEGEKKSKVVKKRQRVNSVSNVSEEEIERNRKSMETSKRKSKENGNSDTTIKSRKSIGEEPIESSKAGKPGKNKSTKENEDTSVELRETVEKKPNFESLTTKKSPKKKTTNSFATESSNTSSESRESIDKKPQITSNDSTSLEKSPKKKKRRKENENSDTSVETQETIERKPKIKSLKVMKSGKEKPSELEEDSEPIIETEITIDEKSHVNLLKMEKPSKKRSSKSNGIFETASESEESIDRKPRIVNSGEVEKSSKIKRKKSENASNSMEDSSPQDEKIVTSAETTIVDDAVSSKKRSKKNRMNETDNEDTTEIRIKSESRSKKKTKSKNHEDVSNKSNADDDADANESLNVSAFEFIKPEIKPEHKKKRRKNVAENNESGEVSQSVTTENNVNATSEFFTDIRIKTEPEPSDVEDAASRENTVKRKKKHGSLKEENKMGKHKVSNEETFFNNVGIKTEPDASDVEDVKSGKKKSKKKNGEKSFVENVKIKEEPNASDVEDLKPKKRLKIESEQDRLKIKTSPRKNDEA